MAFHDTLRSPSGAATALTIVACIARLVSDHKHNTTIEERGRQKAALALRALAGPRDISIKQPKPVAGASRITQYLLLTGLCMLPFGCLLFLKRDQTEAACASLCLTGAAVLLVLYLQALGKDKGPSNAEGGSRNQSKADLQPKPAVIKNLTGTWIKDKKASQSMAAAMELAQLGRLTKTAVKLIKGIQILDTEAGFEMAVFSVIGWFKVRELYPWNGALCRQKRRDLRKGHHTGRVLRTETGDVRLELQWPDPVAGTGFDEFKLVEPDELHVTSRMEVGGEAAAYTVVYRKRQGIS